jgi:hypothetical protein
VYGEGLSESEIKNEQKNGISRRVLHRDVLNLRASM